MAISILLYDKYFNLPMRGIALKESSMLAFVAQELEDEPPEIAGRRGIYAQMRAFECDPDLKPLMDERHGMFLAWRQRFDAGLATKVSHPLLVDQRYQQLSANVDEIFNRLNTPLFEVSGLMHVVEDKWIFESL